VLCSLNFVLGSLRPQNAEELFKEQSTKNKAQSTKYKAQKRIDSKVVALVLKEMLVGSAWFVTAIHIKHEPKH